MSEISNPKLEDLQAITEAVNEIDAGDDLVCTRVEFRTADAEKVAVWWDYDSEAWRLWDWSSEA